MAIFLKISWGVATGLSVFLAGLVVLGGLVWERPDVWKGGLALELVVVVVAGGVYAAVWAPAAAARWAWRRFRALRRGRAESATR